MCHDIAVEYQAILYTYHELHITEQNNAIQNDAKHDVIRTILFQHVLTQSLFNGDGDIYKAMAAQILGKSNISSVTLEERNKAKVICLGWIQCYYVLILFFVLFVFCLLSVYGILNDNTDLFDSFVLILIDLCVQLQFLNVTILHLILLVSFFFLFLSHSLLIANLFSVGTIYGMGPALAAAKLGIDIAAANRITYAFFNSYKEMKLWMTKTKK